MARARKWVFLHRLPPDASRRAAELIEILLIAAAFDQELHVVFLDDGVYQLAQGLPVEVAEELAELEVWVERESLAARGLSAKALAVPARPVRRARIARLLAGQDAVFTA